MRQECLSYLKCIECNGQSLNLNSFTESGDHVITGKITCSCGAEYPIINGVPRILKKNLLEGVLKHYKMDMDKDFSSQRIEKITDIQEQTMDAFGYEWTYYSDYDADNYYDWMPEGFKPEEGFLNKTGLEVGCGAGRHAAKTSQWAKTHIAVDLSYAVDSAFVLNKDTKNCHIIHADAFNLPFKEKSFDYVYCLGVIQHMHNPPEGFTHLAKFPKQDGILLVNAYQASRRFLTGILEVVRQITIRMPAPMLNFLCYIAGIIDYSFCLAWKGIVKLGLGKILGPIVPERVKEYSKHSFKTVVADWYDRLACPKKFHYTREEVGAWYENANYVNIRVTPYWKAFWNGYGERP